MSATAAKDRFAAEAEKAAATERAIQREIDAKEKARPREEKKEQAMQAGARRYPVE